MFALDGSNEADTRKDVLYWGFVDSAGQIPQKQIWGVNGRFKANRAKY